MDTIPENIISLISNGDKNAFEKLFKAYYARLCEYSFLVTKDKDSSMEIVQDFFVKFWENRHKLEIGSVKSYLFRSIHNNSIKYLNKRIILESFENISEEYSYTLPNDFELTEKLEKSIEELPPKCREIFILSRIDKLRHNEIAEQLGISARTVEVQLRKAGIILKEKLKEFYLILIFLFFV